MHPHRALPNHRTCPLLSYDPLDLRRPEDLIWDLSWDFLNVFLVVMGILKMFFVVMGIFKEF
jgi:hypothetical protein